MDSTVAWQLLLKMVVYSTNDWSVQAGCKLRHELKANGLKFTRMFIGGLTRSVRCVYTVYSEIEVLGTYYDFVNRYLHYAH